MNLLSRLTLVPVQHLVLYHILIAFQYDEANMLADKLTLPTQWTAL